MHLTADQLKALIKILDIARQTFACEQPRLDAKGSETFQLTGKTAPVKYGTHGSGYLQVDLDTAAVRCGACAGEIDATATKRA